MPMLFVRCRNVVSFFGLGIFLTLSACTEEPPQPTESIRAIKTVTVAERASGIPRKFPTCAGTLKIAEHLATLPSDELLREKR